MAQLGKKKQRPPVAALFSQEEEFLKAQRERLEALKGTAGGSGGATPPTFPSGNTANRDPSDKETMMMTTTRTTLAATPEGEGETH